MVDKGNETSLYRAEIVSRDHNGFRVRMAIEMGEETYEISDRYAYDKLVCISTPPQEIKKGSGPGEAHENELKNPKICSGMDQNAVVRTLKVGFYNAKLDAP